MTAKVYVVQEQPRLNYSDAQRFGELVFLSRFDYSPGVSGRFNEMVRAAIREGLAQFDPEHDFLLLVGDPVLIGLSFSYAIGKGPVNVLKWDKGARRYTEVRGIVSA